jgi:hypothetical protein
VYFVKHLDHVGIVGHFCMDIIVDVLFLSRAPHHRVYVRRSVLCSVAAAAGCNARTAPHCWSLHARAKMAKPIPIPRSSLVSSPLLSSPLLFSLLLSSSLFGSLFVSISSANTNVFLCKMRSSNFAHFDTHHWAHLATHLRLTWDSLGPGSNKNMHCCNTCYQVRF